MNRVAVLGSANIDLVVKVPRRPGAGETLSGSNLRSFAGGKGANQAAAAARSGASTSLHACVGQDAHGQVIRVQLAKAGVDVRGVSEVNDPTGTALILVTPDGENSIVVSPGANKALDIEFAEATVTAWSEADILVLNLESPMQTVEHAAAMAAARGMRVLINAAPAETLTVETLSLCDPLVVNEHEARVILADNDSSYPELARKFLDQGVRSVVITLGAAGAIYGDRNTIAVVPAFPVDVVDTTGAGDAFVGAVACELARGTTLQEAVSFASAVAAFSVQTMGAQASYPARIDVERWLDGWKPQSPI